jgi:hypothetical protein
MLRRIWENRIFTAAAAVVVMAAALISGLAGWVLFRKNSD